MRWKGREGDGRGDWRGACVLYVGIWGAGTGWVWVGICVGFVIVIVVVVVVVLVLVLDEEKNRMKNGE